MGDYRTLDVVTPGPIGRMTLNRPDKLNALSLELMEEVIDASAELSASPARVVIIAGAGRAFSAGFDLDDFAGGDLDAGDPQRRYAAAQLGERMASAIAEMRPVSIAAMHGHVVGGGLVVAAAADLRVATETMVISVPEVDLGIAYAWGAIPRLVQELGPALTRELVMTCRPFSAAEALHHGFLNRVVPADRLDRAAVELAESIAARPRLPLDIAKRHVNEVLRHDFSRDDAADLLTAIDDPESATARLRYLEAHRRSAPPG